MVLPAFAEDVLDAVHVSRQLALDLTRPNDGTGNGRKIQEAGLRLQEVSKSSSCFVNVFPAFVGS